MDKTTMRTMFSSKSNEWETPQDFYNSLNLKHGFTLDPCATAESAKCSKPPQANKGFGPYEHHG